MAPVSLHLALLRRAKIAAKVPSERKERTPSVNRSDAAMCCAARFPSGPASRPPVRLTHTARRVISDRVGLDDW